MAEHFLTKSRIELSQCLDHAGGLALESYSALRQALSTRGSPEVAELFAEPLINRGNDAAPASIAWYTDVAGDGRPLAELSDAERGLAEAVLAEQLRVVRTVLDDPDDGPLVGAALHLANDRGGDVWVINGRPVIINWGMLPVGAGRDAASRGAHYASTLGRFLPLAAAPPLSSGDIAARAPEAAAVSPPTEATPQNTAVSAAAIGAGAATGAAVVSDNRARNAQSPERRRYGVMSWLPLLLLLLLSGATLAWLLLPGSRIFPHDEPDPAIQATDTVQGLEAINASLVERRDALRGALAGAQCKADGTLIMPGGLTIEGLLPIDPNNPNDRPGQRTDASPTPMLTPDPSRVSVPESGSIDTATLLELIEARTVRVVGKVGTQSASTGSGFFVAPDLVVTNFHVISNPGITEIFVINKKTGRPLAGQVVSKSGPIGENGDDFALLRVASSDNPYFSILRADQSLKLRSVIAAGFPGDLDFAQGAPASLSVPAEMTLTDGTISNEQQLQTSPSGSFNAIAHSAPISQGNSGGPLVDMCGRVVGVNTFVRAGQLRTINFALSSKDLLEFLATTPTAPEVVTRACDPTVIRPNVRAAVTDNSNTALPSFDLPQSGAE